MGQAKLRGTFEQRQAEAVDKRRARQAELRAKHEQQRQVRRESRGEPVAVGTIGHGRVPGMSVNAMIALALATMAGRHR